MKIKFIRCQDKDKEYYPNAKFFVEGYKGSDIGTIVKLRTKHRWEVDDLYMYSDCLRKIADKLDELDNFTKVD